MNLLRSTTYATTYTYNNYKGTLTSVTDANGNETQYSYNDDTDRMTIVEAIDSANKDNNSKVTYIYNKVGQLASISSPGDKTKYYFEYDNWGKNTKVKVGSQELVSNEYEPNNGLLKTQSYGNNFYVTHNYDSLDRESSRVYNDGNSDVAKYYWTYNADGNLARYSENGNRVLTYLYDDIGRLLQVSGNDGSYVKTSYDKFDKSTNLHYKFNGQRRDVYFFYDKKDNLPESVQFGTGSAYTVTNLYDGLTRIYEKDYTLVGSTSGSELKAVYSYKPFDSKVPNRTTGTIQGINYTFTDGGLRTYDRWYTYDHAGNILTEGVWKTNAEKPVYETYTYDAKNQLVKHDSVTLNATFTYTYDVAGNIKSKTIYNKEDGTTSTIDYTYGNSNWKDELTAYGNENIEYDTIGNPTLYRGWTMGWEGRQLKSAGKNGTNLSFTYDSEGIRTSKTVGSTTTKYLLNGTQILAQTTNGKTLSFFYDQQGNRVAMADGNNHFYYYIYNVQGDVIALADASTGKLAATYTYDAWGKIVKINGENPEDVASTNIANINPFRYRGYYYDTETGFYYVSSRYYDPEIGRWINADDAIAGVGGDIRGYNLFAYCMNDPVNMSDHTGHWPQWIKNAASAVVNAVKKAVTVVANTVKSAVSSASNILKASSNSLPKKGEPGSSKTLPNPDGTPKQKRWYGPDGNPERDRDYNHPGNMPFPHDHEWKNGERGNEHLLPDPSYEMSWEPVIGAGLVVICTVGIIAVAADDFTGVGVADDFLFGPLGAGVGEGLIMIFG